MSLAQNMAWDNDSSVSSSFTVGVFVADISVNESFDEEYEVENNDDWFNNFKRREDVTLPLFLMVIFFLKEHEEE